MARAIRSAACGMRRAERVTRLAAAITLAASLAAGSSAEAVMLGSGNEQHADNDAQAGTKGTVVLGNDGSNLQHIKTDSSGELQVDVLTVPNVTIGAAIPAGNNNIGDVDVVTLPNVTIGTLPVAPAMAGAFAIGAVSVDATRDLLPASALSNRKSIAVFNNGTVTVYLGDVSVTTSNGFPLQPGEKVSMDIANGIALYGITAGTACDVRVLEVN